MEKIEYEKLIDPFCIPVIKYLREKKGIETLYCCQGETSEDAPTEDHSKRGYIMALYSPQAVTEFLKIFNSHASRMPYEFCENMEVKIRRHPEYDQNVIVVKLNRKIWPSKEALKHEWDCILSDLKALD